MAKFTPRGVNSQEERNKGRGNFITLKKTNDQFLGYALFVADPEMSDNPGYYEYFEHYTPATGYVACAGDNCPLCAEGDNPNTRAKSMWLVVDAEDDDPDSGEVKIFNLNWSMVQEFSEDGGDLLGRMYRIKRLEGKGNYSIRPKTGKLTKTQMKAALKGIEEDQLVNIVSRQMNRVFEEMDVAAAMEADDDDETENSEPEEKAKATSKSRKGTAAKDDDEETETEEEDEQPKSKKGEVAAFDPEEDSEFEGNVTVVKVNKKQNTATVVDNNDSEFVLYGTDMIDVTEAVKDTAYIVSAAKDEDDDFVLDMWEPVEENGDEPSASGDTPDEIEDETVTVTKVNPSPEDTLEVEMEDGTEFTLFFMGNGEDANGKDWSELDIDDYSVGEKVTISAKKDDDGDMLATVFPEKPKSRKAKAGSGRK